MDINHPSAQRLGRQILEADIQARCYLRKAVFYEWWVQWLEGAVILLSTGAAASWFAALGENFAILSEIALPQALSLLTAVVATVLAVGKFPRRGVDCRTQCTLWTYLMQRLERTYNRIRDEKDVAEEDLASLHYDFERLQSQDRQDAKGKGVQLITQVGVEAMRSRGVHQDAIDDWVKRASRTAATG